MNRAPLVLLHGWGLTPQVWSDLVPRLPPQIQVCAPALPGHGAARAPTPDLAAWSDALAASLPDGATVCGWSLGSLLALDLARRRPEKVARLILVGATPRFVANDGEWPFGLDATTVDGFVGSFADDPAATMRRFVSLQALGDIARRSVTASLAGALADPLAFGRDALVDGLRLLAQTDLRSQIGNITQPAHLLHGAHDALMPVGAARWLADRLPDARLTVFDDCGHAPFLSRPVESAALIAEATLG